MMLRKFETNTYEISENYKNISIWVDTVDVLIEPTTSENTKLVCYENKKHLFEINNETLEIKEDKKWFNLLSIGFKKSNITLFVPKNIYESIIVKCNTGSVNISNLVFDRDINIITNTGKINLENINCEKFTSKCNTGSVMLKNLIASKEIKIKNNTGNVILAKCDANDIFIKTNTGNIEGSFLTEKTFLVNTNERKVKTPKNSTNGICEIKTNTGKVSFQ